MTNTVQQGLTKVRTKLLEIPFIRANHTKLESKVPHLKVEYIAVFFGVVLALSLFSGCGAGLISDIIGFAYPAFETLKAIETSTTEDDTAWLMYWVVFASLFLVENFSEWVLYWIPYYYPLKVTFLLWCMLPGYNGAKLVYHAVIEPLYAKHSSAIDAALFNTAADNKEKKN
jgi:receptor expression-enhancing protein 5/6